MERVTGIGGLFFRARDPGALARWYADHLGIDPAPTSYEQPPWWQQQGPTVLSPFPADSDAFGRPGQAWMLNCGSATWTPWSPSSVRPASRSRPIRRPTRTGGLPASPIPRATRSSCGTSQDALQEPPDRHR